MKKEWIEFIDVTTFIIACFIFVIGLSRSGVEGIVLTFAGLLYMMFARIIWAIDDLKNNKK